MLLGAAAFDLVSRNALAKGDVLATAQLAGICGAKHTATLIPLCHSLNLSRVDVRLTLDAARCAVRVVSEARAVGKTGEEGLGGGQRRRSVHGNVKSAQAGVRGAPLILPAPQRTGGMKSL